MADSEIVIEKYATPGGGEYDGTTNPDGSSVAVGVVVTNADGDMLADALCVSDPVADCDTRLRVAVKRDCDADAEANALLGDAVLVADALIVAEDDATVDRDGLVLVLEDMVAVADVDNDVEESSDAVDITD